MRPAFSSSRQALAFALLILLAMLAPELLARTGWLDRQQVYPALPWRAGPFSYIQQQIFEKKNDADIVFLGSSQIWTAFNTPFIQQQLTAHLHREAEVFTLGWPWPGFDAAYFIGRDLLAHRRVHMLVIYDEDYLHKPGPHVYSSRWFRAGESDDALHGLSLQGKGNLYGEAVLDVPRQLLSIARTNLLEDPLHCRPNYWSTDYRAPNIAENRGALRAKLAVGGQDSLFAPFHAVTSAIPGDAVIYSDATRNEFEFGGGGATEPYQLFFARKLAKLCQESGTELVVLHPPRLHEREDKVIHERENWQTLLGARVEIIGIPPAKLFGEMSAEDVTKLFYEDGHLNQNGQELYTPLMTPTLIHLYDKSIQQH